MNLTEIITRYLDTLDEGIDTLSNHKEGKLSKLPSWVLHKRVIQIGITEDREGIVIKITPDSKLESDSVSISTISNARDINRVIFPMRFEGRLPNKEPQDFFTTVGDMSIVEANNPLAVPVLDNQFMIGWGRSLAFSNSFSVENAKKEAVDMWNAATSNLESRKSYIQETKKVLDKFEAIVRRKSFLERRIHRFINEHRSIFLPEHKTCLFEQRLQLNGETRIADFILGREQGLPSIFIELESPVHEVFTKRGDLTAQVNHARQQVSEWVKYVELAPQSNASGELEFLTGPKERMIIIGKDTDKKDRLIDTKHDGTTVWTYSILLQEARRRMNNRLVSQYKMLGLEPTEPF
ncbi:hypothetical protein Y695_02192 [Hydrogenophaga sp. T4]|nr:hypothetical protein Y695_02192 [Hydrogenophaga sp. T4]